MMKLQWTQRARRDLHDIAAYIKQDSNDAARGWIKRLRDKAQRASEHPRSGRIVPEFRRDDIREILVGNYRIVYRILANAIHVLTVFEGHRSLVWRKTESTDEEVNKHTQ